MRTQEDVRQGRGRFNMWHVNADSEAEPCEHPEACMISKRLHARSREEVLEQLAESRREMEVSLPFESLRDVRQFDDFLVRAYARTNLQEALWIKYFHVHCPKGDPRRQSIDEFFQLGGSEDPFYANFPKNWLSNADIISYANTTQDASFNPARFDQLSAGEKFQLIRPFHHWFLILSRDPEYLRAAPTVIRDMTKYEEECYSRNNSVPEDARSVFIRSLRYEITALNLFYCWDSEIRGRLRLYNFIDKDTQVEHASPSSFEITDEDRQVLSERFPVIGRIERLRALRDANQLNRLLYVPCVWNVDDSLSAVGIDPATARLFNGSYNGFLDLYDRREVARLGLDSLDIKLLADFFRPYARSARHWSNSTYDPKTGLAGVPHDSQIDQWRRSH